jgi:hypothetical protein
VPLQVEDGKSLYRDVEAWRQQEGSVLIVSFGLFSNAVLGLARAKKGKQQQDDDNDADAEADDDAQVCGFEWCATTASWCGQVWRSCCVQMQFVAMEQQRIWIHAVS